VKALGPTRVRLHYDFASSVCYIAHRVLQRIAPGLAAANIEPVWTPIDLARLMGWRRGARVPQDRLDNVGRISRDLRVPLRTPKCWLDSRRASAVAIALCPSPGEATWRERVWTAVFDEGHFDQLENIGKASQLGQVGRLEATSLQSRWLDDLAMDTRAIDEAAIEAGLLELERRTREAHEEMVTGVPTFMLDSWPFGGIQEDDAMLSILTRFAERKRQRAARDPVANPSADPGKTTGGSST